MDRILFLETRFSLLSVDNAVAKRAEVHCRRLSRGAIRERHMKKADTVRNRSRDRHE